MSEKLPFEDLPEEQFNNLRLPDEDQSWQKMKTLLDEEDNKRRPVFFLPKWLGLGLLFLGFSAGAYFLLFNNNTADDKSVILKTIVPGQDQSDSGLSKSPSRNEELKTGQNRSSASSSEDLKKEKTIESNFSAAGINDLTSSANSNFTVQNPSPSISKIIREKSPGKNMPAQKTVQDEAKSWTKENKQVETTVTAEEGNERKSVEVNKTEKLQTENSKAGGVEKQPDSATRSAKPAETPVAPTLDSSRKKTQEKKLFFSAGLGIQQQIPIGGQESVPYDSYGRKVSIADYIPSVFFRMHYENKWFLMGEFRYGAPQKINDFNYAQQSEYDSATMVLATTTMRLKKTYYHQLPLSFNYYVKPGWSVGLGAMYSRFYGAVTEKEIRNYNVYTQDITYTKSIANVRGFTDSFLHKTQFHFIINSDFQYKNFMLGLRFTKDLQPYIKYTKPDGIINEEKNYSLQAILRWQIWRK